MFDSLGVVSQDKDVFYSRFRHRPESLNAAPLSHYLLPTAIASEQFVRSQAVITDFVTAGPTEHYRATTLSAYHEAICRPASVEWDMLNSDLRAFNFPYRVIPIYHRIHDGGLMHPPYLTRPDLRGSSPHGRYYA